MTWRGNSTLANCPRDAGVPVRQQMPRFSLTTAGQMAPVSGRVRFGPWRPHPLTQKRCLRNIALPPCPVVPFTHFT